MSEPFIGELRIWGTTFAPRGWADCHGQLLSISQYSALFSLYGTFYGGDGRTTFGLPDLRGRVPIHVGNGPGLPSYPNQGAKGGATTETITLQQYPSHTHPFQVPCNSGDAGSDTPVDNFPAKGVNSEQIYADAGGSNMGQGTTDPAAGGGQPHDNMQPYQVLRYCCALTGIYPSRS